MLLCLAEDALHICRVLFRFNMYMKYIFYNPWSSLSSFIFCSNTTEFISYRVLSLGKIVWIYLTHSYVNNMHVQHL